MKRTPATNDDDYADGRQQQHAKRKKYHHHRTKQGSGNVLEKRQFEAKDGFKGVLVTCAGKHKEAQTVRELFNLLNEYAESFYPSVNSHHASVDESVSVEDALAQEIAGMKREAEQGQRKFYVLETNVKGLVFIRFTDFHMEPVSFVTRILEHLQTTKQQKTRNAVRLLPIEKTCAVQLDKVLGLISELARPHFPPTAVQGQKKPFTVLFKRRNNDKVRQMETIEAVTKLLGDVGVLNYRHPEVTILVEIFQRACGVSVIPHGAYQRLHDFNLQRIYDQTEIDCPAQIGKVQQPEKRHQQENKPNEEDQAQTEEQSVETNGDAT